MKRRIALLSLMLPLALAAPAYASADDDPLAPVAVLDDMRPLTLDFIGEEEAMLHPVIQRKLTTYPVARALGGRKASISDGYHSRADYLARRAKREHRGCDIMWRRLVPALTAKAMGHPLGSRWYYAPEDVHQRPILSAGAGKVVYSGEWFENIGDGRGKVFVGNAVIIDHGEHVGTAYHHMERAFVDVGWDVADGDVLGIMGGSPNGFGLVHLHFDLALHGKFLDPAPYLARLKHYTLEEAWGHFGRIEPLEEPRPREQRLRAV